MNCSSRNFTSFVGDIPMAGHRIDGVKLILRNNNIMHLPSLFRTKVTFLDMSYNNITHIDKKAIASLPQNLTTLLLNNNQIKIIDEEAIAYFNSRPDVMLRLGHNPFSCKCGNVAFVKFLAKVEIGDKDNITFPCSSPEGPILPEHLCPDRLPAALITCLALLALLLALALVVSRHRKALRHYLLSSPCLLRRYPEDWSLPYDVFISYSHHDKAFVQDLRTQLETDGQYR
jgi:Leucine-rich repeat (LRR) protein